MAYLAKFEEIEGELFRFDTRIYLKRYDPMKASNCLGAIVGKNPGAASPSELGKFAPIEMHGDKMLPTVRNRFIDAYKICNKQIPANSFIRIWNLFYICDPSLKSAYKKASKFDHLPTCDTENEMVPIVWYGWGGDNHKLNHFKQRFYSRNFPNQFFYDHNEARINAFRPSLYSFAKHTQGMPAQPVNEYLASVIE